MKKLYIRYDNEEEGEWITIQRVRTVMCNPGCIPAGQDKVLPGKTDGEG